MFRIRWDNKFYQAQELVFSWFGIKIYKNLPSVYNSTIEDTERDLKRYVAENKIVCNNKLINKKPDATRYYSMNFNLNTINRTRRI
jgi:hypothetical protein